MNGTHTSAIARAALAGEVLHGAAKATAVELLARRESFDLVECVAYSESINDLPLLSMVAHPNAVNPDRRLRRIAVRRGWPIHDFRTRHHLVRVGVPASVA
jgi:phosphoserine phosphatase